MSLFREHAATIVVAACVAAVALINFSSSKEFKGSFFDSFGNQLDTNAVLRNKVAIQNEKRNNLAVAPLTDPTFLAAQETVAEQNYLADAAAYYRAPTIASQAILASYDPTVSGSSGHEQKTYVVKDGDTIGSIAARSGISANTVLWANNLSDTAIIKPGDKLTLLPITGMKYKIQKGDSLDFIVKKYNTDKDQVMAYNQLPADGTLKDGQDLILPDAYLSAPGQNTSAGGIRLAISTTNGQSAYQAPSAYGSTPGTFRISSGGGGGHRFPYGYCTWYVAQRKYVPWGGDARTWLAGARSYGEATGRAPRPGAIMVSGESRWGHVAVVESVSGSSFTVSEMNYAGFGRKSTRTISTNSPFIKGFIY